MTHEARAKALEARIYECAVLSDGRASAIALITEALDTACAAAVAVERAACAQMADAHRDEVYARWGDVQREPVRTGVAGEMQAAREIAQRIRARSRPLGGGR